MIDAHQTPLDMIRTLCSYIADDSRILHEVRSEFHHSNGRLDLSTVRRVRRELANAQTRGDIPVPGDEWLRTLAKREEEMALASVALLDAITATGGRHA